MLLTFCFRAFSFNNVLFISICLFITACGSSEKATESIPDTKARELKKASEKAVEDEEPHTPGWYIHKYKRYAIKEMKESGVPASITLAQGMLESSYAKSKLAKEGKNHFGIKCHKDEWDGGEIYLEDDRPDECFRTYESVFQSYRDHSRFLKDGYRYNDLFKLEPTAYEKWAKGLKDAGYATNPRYDDILIKLIEKHDLHYFDQFHDKPFKPKDGVQVAEKTDKPKTKNEQPNTSKTFEKNGLKAIRLGRNESLSDITAEVSVNRSALIRYNDLNKKDQLKKGDILYLEAKKKKPVKSYHVVEKGETLWDIAQEYGVKYEKLMDRNRLKNNEEPAIGSRVFLRERRYTKVEVREKPLVKNRKKSSKENQEVSNKGKNRNHKPQADNPASYKTDRFHKVRAGETMQQIAQKYDMPVALLYKKNRMENGEQPAVGAKIHLKERRYVKPELKYRQNTNMVKKTGNGDNTNTASEKSDPRKSTEGVKEKTSDEEPSDERKAVNSRNKKEQENQSHEGKKQKSKDKPSGKTANRNIKPSDKPKKENAQTLYHKVKPDETLYGIAKQYGTGIKSLKAWNDLKSNNIETGQKIRVQEPEKQNVETKENKASTKAPDKNDDKPTYHTVADGETLYQISVNYNIPVSKLKALNDMDKNEVEIGQKLRLQPEGDDKTEKKPDEGNKRSFHRVKQGETLYGIAKQHDMAVDKLKSINDLPNNNVDIGQKLYLEEKD